MVLVSGQSQLVRIDGLWLLSAVFLLNKLIGDIIFLADRFAKGVFVEITSNFATMIASSSKLSIAVEAP